MAKPPPLAGEYMGYSYSHLAPSKPVPRRVSSAPVFSIGGQAFVNWPQPPGAAPTPVPMVDGAGKSLPNDLVDGQQVEILSWSPKAREGVTYQVRRRSDGSEWCVAAPYLRRSKEVPIATDAPAQREA